MSDKRYRVIYTGKLVTGAEAETVKSNLVLYLGISEEKAKHLVLQEPKMLKHCATAVEAQNLVEKFERAGIVCVIDDTENKGNDSGGGEHSLLRALKRKLGKDGDPSSLVSKLVSTYQRDK